MPKYSKAFKSFEFLVDVSILVMLYALINKKIYNADTRQPVQDRWK